MQIYAYFDGSCAPVNPGGSMGLGCVIYNGLEKYEYSKRIPEDPYNTNNLAEYQALYALLRLLIKNELQTKSIIIHGDSQLIINQINGDWKVKNPVLKVLHESCRLLLPYFNDITFKWIPREQNTVADALSNF